MARKKKSGQMEPAKQNQEVAGPSESTPKKTARGKKSRARRAAATKSTPRKQRAARRRTRTRYSDEKRQQILAAARNDGLTALEVQKRFGVTPVTYYSWRKKSGAGRRGRPGRPKGSSRGHLSRLPSLAAPCRGPAADPRDMPSVVGQSAGLLGGASGDHAAAPADLRTRNREPDAARVFLISKS